MALTVIISAGHCNATGGGAPGEAQRTPRFARAYVDAFRQAGHTAIYMQQLDDAGDVNPDSYSGSLTALAQRVASIASGIPGDRIVMLDVHIDEASAPRGCFAIVPDDPTVDSGSAGQSADVWARNERSRLAGSAVARAIADAAGFKLRQSTELGLMSERETDVGSHGNRLAMFRHTAALRDRMVRLLIEHGNIDKDLAIIDAPDTASKCALAAERVLRTMLEPPLIAQFP